MGPPDDKQGVSRPCWAASHRLTRDEGIDAVMTKLKLDVLVAPTEGANWFNEISWSVTIPL